jgi:hypothetical protein
MSNTTVMSPVAVAVEPLRAQAVNRAGIEAQAYADRMLAMYAENPSIANYPTRVGKSEAEREIAYMRYQVIHRITIGVKVDAAEAYRLGRERIEAPRVADPARIESFVAQAKKDAEAAYTAFIYKLEEKIGAHESASLTGDHVWGYSLLTVTKGATVETWKTQQIINVSKKGKVFNQWPTRTVKR